MLFRSPVVEAFGKGSFHRPAGRIVGQAVGDKRDLPVADLLFEDTVGPSPVMVERQGGKELAHRALVLSVQRIALVAVDGQDTVVHPIVAVVCAVCSQVEVGDASVTFLVVGMERKTPGIVELIVDVQERIGSQIGRASCRERV